MPVWNITMTNGLVEDNHDQWPEIISTPYGNARTYTLRDDGYNEYPRIESGDWLNREVVKLKDLI